ncbi:MAG: hypothetical protein GY861_17110 [bacterium]|nr:hypothetical protein [bacterium]
MRELSDRAFIIVGVFMCLAAMGLTIALFIHRWTIGTFEAYPAWFIGFILMFCGGCACISEGR